jgi:4-hydroxy-tetrahydrodipicolinate reductase
MGAALDQHIAGLEDLSVTARLDAGEDLAAFIAAGVDVAVDLSNGAAVAANGPAICRAGVPYIIGSTGIPEETIAELRELAGANSPVLLVPNFSIGACLMMEFAAMAARLMRDPVITERHHKAKLDAPSGTALHTAREISATHGNSQRSKPAGAGQQPAALGSEVDGVRIHSIRGDGYLAEQQVLLTLPGESLEISHRSIDRRCFMEGIVLAVRNIRRLRGFNVGLGSLLEIR